MLCTQCNEVVRPVVAVDIDGTLGNYIDHFIRHAAGYLNDPLLCANYRGAMPFKVWCCQNWGISAATWSDIKLTYRQGAQKRTMPMYGGADVLVNRIRERAELWLTTTRPYLRHDNIDPDTRAWLDRHDIKYDGLIYDERKYEQLANIVGAERVCAVLDDLPEEIGWASDRFAEDVPILRRTKHNQMVTVKCSEAFTLHDAAKLINIRIEDWERRHARRDIEEGSGSIRRTGDTAQREYEASVRFVREGASDLQ